VQPRADSVAQAAESAARDSYGRLLALLAASTRDIGAAEDALADAFERALRNWPRQGVPDRPDAWLLAVARNRLRDEWKSARARYAVALDVERDAPQQLDVDPDEIPDLRLALMLACSHPALDRSVHTPLMLNTVLGCTAEQIGQAFSIPTSTMATRLVRAKKRIKATGIPFRIPERADLPPRMTSVLEAVYGAYAIDWATTGPQPRAIPSQALQLAELVSDLAPEDPEAHGLAALVELSTARAPARTDSSGLFVPLLEQDPARWDSALIERAHAHLRLAHALGQVGRFQLEAAIQSVHCARRNTGTTDWSTLLSLHRTLDAIAPSLGSGVALAAVVAETAGPAAGLQRLRTLHERYADAARRFQPAWALRAHLLHRLGRLPEAVEAYDHAIKLTHEPAARHHLRDKRNLLGG
jgi:predicted RNA polymerase sigma factor